MTCIEPCCGVSERGTWYLRSYRLCMAQPYKGPRIQLKVRVTPEVHARLSALVAERITTSVSQAAADLLAFGTDLAEQAREIHEVPQPGLWDQEVTWTSKSA